MNKDKLLDLIVGNAGGASKLYLNLGDTGAAGWDGFDAGTTLFTSADTSALAVGDLNGDGFRDLVVGNDGSASQVFLNLGQGATPDWDGFALSGTDIGTAAATKAVAIGDVNGDGLLDVVLGNAAPDVGEVLVNRGLDGAGTSWLGFRTGIPVGAATAVTSAVLVNVDTDHDLDLVLGVDGAASMLFRTVQTPLTRVAFSGVTVSLDDGGGAVGIADGQGALVMTSGGIAGTFSGNVSAAGGPFSSDISIAVRINTTTQTFDEEIEVGGTTIPLTFGAAEVRVGAVNFIQFSGSGVIKLGDFVEIRGSVTFGGAESSGTDISVFLGQGPGFLDDGSPNPTARGVMLTNASFKAIDVGGLRAFSAVGDISVVGVPGVVFQGSSVRVKFNQTGAAQFVGTDDEVAIGEQAFAGILAILIDGQGLTGHVAFTKNVDGTFDVTLGDTLADTGAEADTNDVVLNLGDGPTYPVSVRVDYGSLTMSQFGIYGQLTATPTINVDGFDFTADVTLRINQTANPVDLDGPGGADPIPAHYLRVEANGVDLNVLGQTLSGNFAFEQVVGSLSPQAPADAVPPKIVRIAASNVSLFVGDDGGTSGFANISDDAGVWLTDGSGFFVLTPAGLAGQIGGTVTFAIPGGGVTFTGTFGVAINTTVNAVAEQFEVGQETINLNLPAGPYLRVQGTGVELSLLGQKIGGDFSFEQASAGGRTVTRVVARNVTAAFGDGTTDFVTLDGGYGFFILQNDPDGPTNPKTGGLAGEIGGTVSVAVPGVTLQGTFSLAINNTNSEVAETITFGDQPGVTHTMVIGDVNGDVLPDLVLGTDAGDLVYLNDGEGNPFDTLAPLQIGSETGTTAFALGDVDADGDPDLIVGNNGAPNHVYLNDGSGVFLLATGPGVTVLGSSATTAVVLGDVNGDTRIDLVIGVDGGPSVLHLNNGIDATGVWLGFAAATGLTDDTSTSTTSLALADVDGDHTLDLIVGNNGQADHLYLNTGTGFGSSQNIGVQTDATTSIAVGDVNGDEKPDVVFGIGGGANRLHLNLGDPGGDGWDGFSAGASVNAAANATTAVVLVDVDTDGDLDLIEGNNGQANAVYLNNGHGVFTPDTTGILGGGTGSTLALAVGDVDIDGNVDLIVGRDDVATVHLNDEIGNLGSGKVLGRVTLELEAGPYLRIAGENIVLSIAGQTLTGSFAFEQKSLPDGIRIVSVDVPQATLSLADGAFDLDVSGSMLITAGGLGGKLSLGTGLTIGPVSFVGEFNVLVNTSLAPIILDDFAKTRLPGGPNFKIEGLGVTLDIAGAVLDGNFAIEQSANKLGQKRLLIGVSDASFSLPGLTDILTDVNGIFVLLPDPPGVTTTEVSPAASPAPSIST